MSKNTDIATVHRVRTDFSDPNYDGELALSDDIVHKATKVNNEDCWLPITSQVDTYSETIAVAAEAWDITHNLNTSTPLVQVYTGGVMEDPANQNYGVTITGANTLRVTWPSATSGEVVIIAGYGIGTAYPPAYWTPDAYDSAVLADSPIWYFPADDESGSTLYEVVNNNYVGTVSGAAYQAAGPSGTGWSKSSLDLSAGKFITPNISTTTFPAYTIECWMLFNNYAGNSRFFYLGGSSNDNDFACTSQGNPGFSWNGTWLQLNWTKGTGIWYHVVVTKSITTANGTMRGWQDGVDKGSVSYAGDIDNNNPCIVGQNPSDNQNGSIRIAGLAFYDRVLTSTEINNHRNASA